MSEPIIKAKENCHYAIEEGKIMDIIWRIPRAPLTPAMFNAENYGNIIQAGPPRSPVPQKKKLGSLTGNSFIALTVSYTIKL